MRKSRQRRERIGGERKKVGGDGGGVQGNAGGCGGSEYVYGGFGFGGKVGDFFTPHFLGGGVLWLVLELGKGKELQPSYTHEGCVTMPLALEIKSMEIGRKQGEWLRNSSAQEGLHSVSRKSSGDTIQIMLL